MPILEEKSTLDVFTSTSTDPGLVYLEAQKAWSHRYSHEMAVVSKYFAAIASGSLRSPVPKAYPLNDRVALRLNLELLDKNFLTLLGRRSTRREFSQSPPLDFESISTLLWAAYGPQAHANPQSVESTSRINNKTAPIPGGIQSLEFYLVALDIEALRPGVYHFHPTEMAFERVAEGDTKDQLATCYPDEAVKDEIMRAKGAIFVTSVFDKLRVKYGHRYLKFALLEAGFTMQNLELAATALDLGLWLQGSHFEDRAPPFLKVDGISETILISCLLGNWLES